MLSRTLRVNEIFNSIQGESTHAGRPCAFVRLMGCPLRCTYCDTAYAFHEGVTKSFDEVFAVLKEYGTPLVELTGGEPLAQPNAIPFMQEAIDRGYEMLIETSGAFPIANVPPAVKIILDIKTPGSNESHRNHWDNMGHLKPGLDEVKFVITSQEDFDFAVATVRHHKLHERVTVLVSPSHGQVAPRDLAQWVIDSKLPLRMQLQMHKYIWGAETRGV
ncbi:MAG: radical SAM protein [Bdellovibrionales bacterium]|nr:radical SAM protein [Bdellovibrionales bacterium]